MKTWTPQAASRLEAYLLASAEREGLAGLPASEYRNELRREIFDAAGEEISEIINLNVFEAMLARIDPDFPTDEISRTGSPGSPRSRRSDFLIWSGAVLLPLLVLVFEVVTSACASMLFDPMPTLWHLLLIALVPVANAWLLTPGAGANDEWKGAAAGASLIVAGFYGALFLPMLPISLLALLIVGAGLLSLSPVLAAAGLRSVGSAVHLDAGESFAGACREQSIGRGGGPDPFDSSMEFSGFSEKPARRPGDDRMGLASRSRGRNAGGRESLGSTGEMLGPTAALLRRGRTDQRGSDIPV